MNALLILISLFQINSSAIELAHGDQFFINEIYGEVTVLCPTNSGVIQKVNYKCRAKTLFPTSYDYITDESLDADDLTISYINSNNIQKNQTIYYNSSAYRTSVRIRLWSEVNEEYNLLHLGENLLQFSARKRGMLVRKDFQKVFVSEGDKKQCPSRSFYSNDPITCEDQSLACDQYFNDENFCNELSLF